MHNRKCGFCDVDIFIKVKVNTKPILAPLTHEQELIDELIDITGEKFVCLQKKFCPVCGREVGKRNG